MKPNYVPNDCLLFFLLFLPYIRIVLFWFLVTSWCAAGLPSLSVYHSFIHRPCNSPSQTPLNPITHTHTHRLSFILLLLLSFSTQHDSLLGYFNNFEDLDFFLYMFNQAIYLIIIIINQLIKLHPNLLVSNIAYFPHTHMYIYRH